MSTNRTEPPTPRKLRELRRRGEVPSQRELIRTAALAGTIVGLVLTFEPLVSALGSLASACLGGGDMATQELLIAGWRLLLMVIAQVAGAGAAAALGVGLLVNRFLWSPRRLVPQTSRLDPSHLLDMESRVDAAIRAGVGAVAAITTIAIGALSLPRIVRALSRDAADAAASVGALATSVVPLAVGWGVILLAVTVALHTTSRASFLRRHRMSKQEIEEESKRAEGDPQHRARRQRAHRQLLEEDIQHGVAEADVIVRNPRHIAVGLRYDPEVVDAPTVTIRGRGEDARRIIRAARRRRVPEFHDRSTARALIEIPVGDPIPDKLFEPVAIIFRWARQLEEGEESPAH